jgi:hypothetical protein
LLLKKFYTLFKTVCLATIFYELEENPLNIDKKISTILKNLTFILSYLFK